jgi:type III pantothenate kinase
MYLAIDIGNTTVNIGYFENHILGGSFRISSTTPTTSEKVEAYIREQIEEKLGEKPVITGVGISSVVPSLTDTYSLAVKKHLQIEPKLLSHKIDLGFRILYDDPAQLGTDRLANVIAARKLYGFPILIIDLGTATKYEVIDSHGDYLGGIIAPGARISAESLFEKGAQLFPVKLERPDMLIGTTTEGALKSGIYYGFLGQLSYLKERIGRELGLPKLMVVATGGYADLFQSDLFDKIDPGLTLKGIELALNHIS